MENRQYFWIFSHIGLGDHIVCNALYRYWAAKYPEKFILIPVYEHNLAAVQFMLQDCPSIFFYPIEQESQLLECRNSIHHLKSLRLGFYAYTYNDIPPFNPVKWDSEFYRQANLDPELSYSGFKTPEFKDVEFKLYGYGMPSEIQMLSRIVYHHDPARNFVIKNVNEHGIFLNPQMTLQQSCFILHNALEVNCIDSSMLCLADRLEMPFCKRFVFHRYARKGLPPTLRKPWEILD